VPHNSPDDDPLTDASDSSAPPIPKELLSYFTCDHAIVVTDHKLHKDIVLGVPTVWTEATINQCIAEAATGTLDGTYGIATTNLFRNDIVDLPMRDKSVQ
jgi:hypothetical protein